MQLGACYYKSDAYREAVAPLEKYVAARPKDFDGFYYLGHSHFNLRQFDQAVRPCKRRMNLSLMMGLRASRCFGSCLATGRYATGFQALSLSSTWPEAAS